MDAMRDSDTTETQESLDAVAAVKEHRGVERAAFIVSSVVEAAQRDRIYSPQSLTTPYCNTIPLEHQPALPGDRAIEHKLRSIIRWNARPVQGRRHQVRQGRLPLGGLRPGDRQWPRRGLHQATVRHGNAPHRRRRDRRDACRRSDQRNLPSGRDGLRAGRYRQDHSSAPDARRVHRHGC